jgi:hypothetical protein
MRNWSGIPTSTHPPPPLVPRRRPPRPRRRVLVADALPGTADKASCSGVAFGRQRAPRATVYFSKTKEQAIVVLVSVDLFAGRSLQL